MAYWLKYYIRRSNAIVARSCKASGRLRQRNGLIVKGKRISCPPHYAPPNNDYDPPHHDYEHGFPLIRSLRASTQRSTSVLFSFVLSLLIVVGSFVIRQSKNDSGAILSSEPGDSTRSSAALLKKERERRKKDARAPHSMLSTLYMSYPPPETARSLIS